MTAATGPLTPSPRTNHDTQHSEGGASRFAPQAGPISGTYFMALRVSLVRAQLLLFRYLFYTVEVMGKREYLGQLELMVLLCVARPSSQEAYGVSISRDIARSSGRQVALASVYAALERLERKGFVVSSLGEPRVERGGKARTYFLPTPAGIKEAREAHATLMRLSSGLPALKGEPA